MVRHLLVFTICASVSVIASGQEQFPSFGGPLSFGSSSESPGSLEVSAELIPVDATTADLAVSVQLPSHNYIYSTDPSFGAATKIAIKEPTGIKLVGKIRPDRAPESMFDENFQQTVEKFYDKVTWTQRVQLVSGQLTPGFELSGQLTGQYCSGGDGGTCRPIIPPAKFTASLPADFAAAAPTAQSTVAAGSKSTVVVVPKMRLPNDLQEAPVHFTVSLTPRDPAPGEDVILTVRADIDEPFHTYSITQNPEVLGTAPTEIVLETVNGLQQIGTEFSVTPAPKKTPGIDEGEIVELHDGSVEWTRRFTLADDSASVEGRIVCLLCDDHRCLELTTASFTVELGSGGAAVPLSAPAQPGPGDVVIENEFGNGGQQEGLVAFIVTAVGFGFISLLTPCVFPMIPVTISYFLKQGSERPGHTLKLAIIYCLGIVGAFTVLGLLLSILFGPTALNQLANNPWLNLFFAGVFTVFALMLMGMFEVRVPSWLLTWTSKKQESGGAIGVLFMALTFTLVSFTCTFAFVGQLVVLAAKGSYLMPIIGMIAFSTAFASPFFFLALFPSLLAKLPKSGGWMNSVKVTMGLLELAVVSKFLSVADTGFSPTGTPQFLDYHLVMATWISVSVVTGLYLLGVFRMPHDSPSETVGPIRCLFSMSFIGFAAYIALGLFTPEGPEGVVWEQLVAFAPPQINYSNTDEGYFVEHDGLQYSLDFDQAVETASSNNQLMFLDFTGVNCINCRRMEKGVLASKPVHSVIKDLVRVQLYVDEVPGVKTKPDEHERLLSRNHGLQENWFGDVTIPAYVIATPDGQEILATFKGLDTDGDEFQLFLQAGLERWRQHQSSAVVPAAAIQNASFTTH
ncbi:MAG: cytochrome c biogenesis protein CcdA [Fuerstiella sp.]|nr:cytochrome c biogenesis protein CcdA [Fuerstiella sp.]